MQVWMTRAQPGGMGACRRGGAHITAAVWDTCAQEKGHKVRGYGLPWHGSMVLVHRGGHDG